MSPRKASFKSDDVLEAAVAVVRERGLANLSARTVALRLNASVAPVYKHFRSMEDLVRGVLETARGLMDQRTRQAYSDIPFLNIGVGIVVFAREESHLFSALFHSRHHCQDILKTFYKSVLARMKEDRMLRLLTDASLENLLQSIWLYTLGLATAVIYGQLPDARTETIIRLLKIPLKPLQTGIRHKGWEILDQIAVFQKVGWRFHLVVTSITTVDTLIGGVVTYILASRTANIHAPALLFVWLCAAIYVMGRLPISVANLGVREITLVGFLAFYNVEKPAALLMSMILFSALVVMAIVGAVYQIVWAIRGNKVTPPAANDGV